MIEESFLRAVLDNPKDATPLSIYADWLAEQSDPVAAAKAEFLRITLEVATRPGSRGWRKARRKRLQELATTLDTNWLAVVSRLRVESCQGKREEAEGRNAYLITFDYVCDRRWEDLRPTDNRAVRSCEGCGHDVHYCDTITEARRHAWAGHCIAVDLGVIRRDQDLEPPRTWVGMPSVETLRRERERNEPDAVSAERERKKQRPRTSGGEDRSSAD